MIAIYGAADRSKEIQIVLFLRSTFLNKCFFLLNLKLTQTIDSSLGLLTGSWKNDVEFLPSLIAECNLFW